MINIIAVYTNIMQDATTNIFRYSIVFPRISRKVVDITESLIRAKTT